MSLSQNVALVVSRIVHRSSQTPRVLGAPQIFQQLARPWHDPRVHPSCGTVARSLAPAAAAALLALATPFALSQSCCAEHGSKAGTSPPRDLKEWAKELGEGATEEFDLQKRLASLKKRDDKSLIHDTLSSPRRIKLLRIWHFDGSTSEAAANLDSETLLGRTRIVALVNLGDELNGHVDIIHGGFTSALLDELFGWVAAIDGKKQVTNFTTIFTANLTVNYRRPIAANAAYSVEVVMEKLVRQKKMYLKATVRDATGKVMVEGTSLYIAIAKPLA